MKDVMCALALPPVDLELRTCRKGAEVFDPLRRKWLVLTPEEWVRQHFTAFLHSHLDVPLTFMANEMTIELNAMSRRCDTVIYSPTLRPVAIVEYKAPKVKITGDVFRQICSYNLVLRVPYLIVSNGLSHYCCRVDSESGALTFLDRLPVYDEMIHTSGRP